MPEGNAVWHESLSPVRRLGGVNITCMHHGLLLFVRSHIIHERDVISGVPRALPLPLEP